MTEATQMQHLVNVIVSEIYSKYLKTYVPVCMYLFNASYTYFLFSCFSDFIQLLWLKLSMHLGNEKMLVWGPEFQKKSVPWPWQQGLDPVEILWSLINTGHVSGEASADE